MSEQRDHDDHHDHEEEDDHGQQDHFWPRCKRYWHALITSLTLALILDAFTIVPVAAAEVWLWGRNAGPLALATRIKDITADRAIALYVVGLIILANLVILIRFFITMEKYERSPGAQRLKFLFLAILLLAGILFTIYVIKVLTQYNL